jgi:Domain of unknown function (DUF397)
MTTSGPGSLARAIWRKSSHSSPTSNNCVEAARNLPGVVAVRDSKDPYGGVLRFGPDEWKTFVEGIRTGSGC